MSEKHLCVCNFCNTEENLQEIGRYGDTHKEPKKWIRQNINGELIDLCPKCESKLIKKKNTVKNYNKRKEQIIKLLRGIK